MALYQDLHLKKKNLFCLPSFFENKNRCQDQNKRQGRIRKI
jgi:hypothetical protein